MSRSKPSIPDADFDSAVLSVQHIGGIDRTEIAFEQSVTLLTGRNATNRTSLLSALGGVLGGTTANLKTDADEGHVTLELEGEEYTRTYRRTGSGIEAGDEPFTDDETLVDLFVTLLNDNPVRRTVEQGEDLRSVIMRPVDTDAIEARIDRLRTKRSDLKDEIASVDRRRNQLPSLEQKRESLKEKLVTIDREISALREEVAGVEESIETTEEAAEVLEALNERRHQLSDVTERIEVLTAEIDALDEERSELKAELAELGDPDKSSRNEIAEELQAVRDQQRDLEETISSLTEVVEFNERLLDEENDIPGFEPADIPVTEQLAPAAEQTVVCWTCGTRVEKGSINDRLDELRAVIDDKRNQRAELAERIDELQARRDDLQTSIDTRNELDEEIDRIDEKITTREAELTELRERKATLDTEIEDLESQAAEAEELHEKDLLETYERISELQYERGQLEQQLDDVEAEIEEIESLPDHETLEEQLDSIQAELETERGRIEELERAAVEAFNEHMAELLEILDYENLARIWLERRTIDSNWSEARSDASFDLHIVRESSDGTVYEDSIENLSESEREVIGLVVALAGYLVHEVYDRLPFVLLDSVEAIDATRIADLVDYFADYAPYLIVALLPEDAEALDGSYDRIAVKPS
ncbi:MAG: archaea-specific SMC-related protein [Halobacteriales archaeon]